MMMSNGCTKARNVMTTKLDICANENGCITSKESGDQHRRRNQHAQFSSWDDELNELRQRLETLEDWRRYQHEQPSQCMEANGLQPIEGGETTDVFKMRRSTLICDNTPAETSLSNQSSGMQNENKIIDRFELPRSTYSFLITEKIRSIPFIMGLVASALSIMCLMLVLLDELESQRPGNPLGLPAGLSSEVRMAQYLGIIVGVLMENEIPTGLELIGKGAEQEIYDGKKFSMKRIVFSSLLRLTVGYLFLLCLFLVVVQESTVLGIFFDVLALEFVENIDDVLFALFRRGFFGRVLKRATNHIPPLECSKKTHGLRRWTKQFIRFVYILNACLGLTCLTILTMRQEVGSYRCTKILVSFEDELWENAFVTANNGPPEKRLLIFSHFNGLYEENGTHDGRPRYIERNKERGEPFINVIPAEIAYCEDIQAWVFNHDNIRTSLDGNNENPCSWLMKSSTTDSYDLIELGKGNQWFVWKGLIESKREVSIECYQCEDEADCNYNGLCEDGECTCNEGYFGSLCQFVQPCDVLRSEKDENTTLQLLRHPHVENNPFVESYGRPVYVIRNMSGIPFSLLRLGYPEIGNEYFHIEYPNSTIENANNELTPHKHVETTFFDDDDFFEQNFKNREEDFKELLKNYTFTLHYTGRRWYGDMLSPDMKEKIFSHGHGVEYHAFWDNAFSGVGFEDNTTFLISAPTFGGSPTAVDFYETRRRNIVIDDDIYEFDYDPFGVLLPLAQYQGSGFFHCNKDS